MTIAPSFDLQSEADLPELSFAAMQMAMLHEAQSVADPPTGQI